MRNIRAIFTPMLVLAAVCFLALLNVQVPAIADFSFFWDVLLGAGLGVALALMPSLAGFAQRRNATTSMFWVCGFVTLLLIFYQYMHLVTGLKINAIAFLSSPTTRLRVVEGAVLGYCSLIAGRGKI